MLKTANACPRCRGTLTRVADIGETYRSCLQCGHVVYGEPSGGATEDGRERWQSPEVADRSSVRRRLIAKERQKAGRRQAA